MEGVGRHYFTLMDCFLIFLLKKSLFASEADEIYPR